MDLKTIARQMIQFHEAAFDNTFDAMTVMQQQAEKIIIAWVSGNPLITAEGEKAINGWLSAYRKSREDFKAAVDDNYRKVEQAFVDSEWTPPVRTVDTPAAGNARPAGKAPLKPAVASDRHPQKAAKKTAPSKKKAPAKKAPEKKAPAKKAPEKKAPEKKATNIDIVTGLIQASTEGISTGYLKEKTGFTERQIWNIVNNAAKEGKIRKMKRGLYCAVPMPGTKPEGKEGAAAEPGKEATRKETLIEPAPPEGLQELTDSAVPGPRGEG